MNKLKQMASWVMENRKPVLIVIAALWLSWLFRYESISAGLILDRWTGDVVAYYGSDNRIELSDIHRR